jgi:hypothetical protein
VILPVLSRFIVDMLAPVGVFRIVDLVNDLVNDLVSAARYASAFGSPRGVDRLTAPREHRTVPEPPHRQRVRHGTGREPRSGHNTAERGSNAVSSPCQSSVELDLGRSHLCLKGKTDGRPPS